MTVSVDGTVLERIAKIMTYLRLGSSGKVNLLMAEDKCEVLLLISVSFVTKLCSMQVLKKKKKENGGNDQQISRFTLFSNYISVNILGLCMTLRMSFT
mgnify:CR=1 FL=1